MCSTTQIKDSLPLVRGLKRASIGPKMPFQLLVDSLELETWSLTTRYAYIPFLGDAFLEGLNKTHFTSLRFCFRCSCSGPWQLGSLMSLLHIIMKSLRVKSSFETPSNRAIKTTLRPFDPSCRWAFLRTFSTLWSSNFHLLHLLSLLLPLLLVLRPLNLGWLAFLETWFSKLLYWLSLFFLSLSTFSSSFPHTMT